METEILWTPENEEEADLIPGRVTDVRKFGREVRIFFSGQHGPTGDKFNGVLRLRLRQGIQTTDGKQSYKQIEGEWELVPYSVTGKFEDRKFENFSGIWTERGAQLRVDVLSLPFFGKPVAKKGKTIKPRKPRSRRTLR